MNAVGMAPCLYVSRKTEKLRKHLRSACHMPCPALSVRATTGEKQRHLSWSLRSWGAEEKWAHKKWYVQVCNLHFEELWRRERRWRIAERGVLLVVEEGFFLRMRQQVLGRWEGEPVRRGSASGTIKNIKGVPRERGGGMQSQRSNRAGSRPCSH